MWAAGGWGEETFGGELRRVYERGRKVLKKKKRGRGLKKKSSEFVWRGIGRFRGGRMKGQEK